MGRKLLTPQELADYLNVKISTIYGWVFQDFLPHIKITGKCVRFKQEEIEEWLKKKSHQGRIRRVPSIDLKTGDFVD